MGVLRKLIGPIGIGVLLLAQSAGAAIILSVVEATSQTANPGLELQVNVEITGGSGPEALGFSFIGVGATLDGECDVNGTTNSDTDYACGASFGTLTFIGSQGTDGVNLGWGAFSGPAADGLYLNIASISMVSGNGFVSLGALYASSGFVDITDQISVLGYTIPEPGTAALLGLGLVLLGTAGRRFR